MSHGDEAEELPAGFQLTAQIAECRRGHRERANERCGRCSSILKSTTRRWARTSCATSFSISAAPSRLGRRSTSSTRPSSSVRQQVGDGPRHLRALGRRGFLGRGGAGRSRHARSSGKSRLTCVFVNNGVLRKNEFEKVQQNLRDKLGLHLVAVDATERFLNKLAGVTDPETKRKIIGNEFIAVFDEEAHRIEKDRRQSRLAGAGHALSRRDRIALGARAVADHQVHHNVGGLPEKMKLKLIEPLKDLFKDEVRRIGRDLGMPEEILQRQPFPGPGLAVRILGEVTAERVALLQECDEIVVTEIKNAGLYTKIWQSFAVLLPVMSVGVMGDQRTYAYTCAIRAVHSEDGMTADWVAAAAMKC